MSHDVRRDGQVVYGSPVFLRLALGFVYFHFGMLKFFPDLSPAEMIATQTVMAVSFHWLDANSALFVLAIMETLIGVFLMFNWWPRVTFTLFIFHMIGTFMPLLVLPEFTFKIAPLAPSIEGQYILKNLVFVAAGWTVLLPHVLVRRARSPQSENASSDGVSLDVMPIKQPSTPTAVAAK
ncbi:MAG: DoxX family membrane protein [Pirellulaceae bacterium]|nr:DoxX family membrane protein [Planctomycetales bacterium]